jgi:hypothetical protein
MAQAMVAAGHAIVENANGRVKSIRLLQCASASLIRIGPPSGGWMTPPYSMREKLDCGVVVWRHHSRSLTR